MTARPPCPLPLATGPQPARHLGAQSPPPPLSLDQAMAEASRCLSQGTCFGCEVCELICPDQAISRDPDSGRRVVDLSFCKGCGLCAHLCPKGAIVMEPEV